MSIEKVLALECVTFLQISLMLIVLNALDILPKPILKSSIIALDHFCF
ncbi:hypothetical protein X975_06878, partial [Stegodyphus mimosarum]